MNTVIEPIKKAKGAIEVPGDKSISQRALILGSLAQGRTEIDNFLPAQDVMSNLNCLRRLGVEIDINSPEEVVVHGVGLFGFCEPEQVLDCGNSGTTLRMLPGLLSAQKFFSVLTGDSSIRRRPVDRIIKPLSLMGAQIQARENNTLPPIAISGATLTGIEYKMPIPSAQVKSAILIAGLLAMDSTTIIEEFRSRDHTERMLQLFQARIGFDGLSTTLSGGFDLSADRIVVPGDISSAAFFIALGLLIEDAEITLANIGLNSTRTGFLDVLDQMNACLVAEDIETVSNEPRGTLIIEPCQLIATEVKGDIIPRLIDELPLIAVLATQAKGTTIVSGAKELRIKETDRIKAICTELRKMGADINELDDGFEVNGPTSLMGANVESHGDHRIAMALAIAGSIAESQTIIENSECVDISFPNFFELLSKLHS